MIGRDKGCCGLGHKVYSRPLIVGKKLNSPALLSYDLIALKGFDGDAAYQLLRKVEKLIGKHDYIYGSYLNGLRWRKIHGY